MESWENKKLGDKLNSLHELPAGYSPNLSAKWEIVEAGLPTTEKRRILPLFLRWSVAAAVLLVIGLVWLHTGEKKADGMLTKQDVAKQFPLQNRPSEFPKVPADSERSLKSQPSHEIVAISVEENPEQHNQLAYRQSSKAATIPVREDTNRSNADNISSIANLSLPPDSITPKTIQQPAATIALEEKPRPVKKRIYQRDFNDGVLVMDTGSAPASRQHFSVQLNPFSRKATGNSEEAAPRLQLKQVF